jgi:isopentenyl-diphosphate Delta-isomerase
MDRRLGGVTSMPRPGPLSLIDRVDDSNQPIGTIPRADAFAAKANFRTVHVLVFSPHGELLLQQLAPTRERNPLKWGSSVAGYLHAGETYEHAAQRRLKEELGLVTRIRPVGVTPMNDKGITKFVGIYTTVSEHAYIAEPDHIATIVYKPVEEVIEGISANPEDYTETLRHVLAYWLGRGRPGQPSLGG